MTSPASPAPKSEPSSNAEPPSGSAGPKAFQGKLTAARLEELREWVEGSNLSYKRIGEAMGVSPATISRYATQEGWQRPPGAPLPSRMGLQRERVREKLWRLTERHAAALEDQPIEVAQRSLQPLARLTRILGDLEKHAPPPRPVQAPSRPPPPTTPGRAAPSTNCATNSWPTWSGSTTSSAMAGRSRAGGSSMAGDLKGLIWNIPAFVRNLRWYIIQSDYHSNSGYSMCR
jgi:hypothetical protein